MRKDNLILIAAILAVVVLVIAIPTFVNGCGGDDTTVDCYRVAQQVQDRDRDLPEDSGRPGMQRGQMGRENMGQGAYCYGDCPRTDCDGDCLGTDGDCLRTDCDGDRWGVGATDDEPFGSEPICF